jgi:hypothetical protein
MPLSSLQSPITEIQTTPSLSPALSQAAVTALWKNQIFDAIKLVRLEQDIGFDEAKELVDSYLRSQPTLRNQIEEARADAREGLFRWLIFLLAGGMGLAYVLM